MTPPEPEPASPFGTHLAPPDREELAAVIAAIELVWPRPRAVAGTEATTVPRWRFSGRWWSKPIPSRRDRPG